VAIGGLDRQAFRVDFEDRAPVGCDESRVDGVLATSIYFESLVDEHVGPAFHAPERAAERQVHGERAHARPAVQTAVRIKHEGQ
jgi:hypothetical protein